MIFLETLTEVIVQNTNRMFASVGKKLVFTVRNSALFDNIGWYFYFAISIICYCKFDPFYVTTYFLINVKQFLDLKFYCFCLKNKQCFGLNRVCCQVWSLLLIFGFLATVASYLKLFLLKCNP